MSPIKQARGDNSKEPKLHHVTEWLGAVLLWQQTNTVSLWFRQHHCTITIIQPTQKPQQPQNYFDSVVGVYIKSAVVDGVRSAVENYVNSTIDQPLFSNQTKSVIDLKW